MTKLIKNTVRPKRTPRVDFSMKRSDFPSWAQRLAARELAENNNGTIAIAYQYFDDNFHGNDGRHCQTVEARVNKWSENGVEKAMRWLLSDPKINVVGFWLSKNVDESFGNYPTGGYVDLY